jgi:4-phosphopantoate--beta-alanine ligase
MLLLAKQPALSVNGNVAALVPDGMVELSKVLKAPIEVNLFHRTEERVEKIAGLLLRLGAGNVLGEDPDETIPGLDHARSMATRGGIYDADVVLIPLEDGDRCEALVRMGKKVIAIDLNPLSRTSRMATVTIVDNIMRAVPNLISIAKDLSLTAPRDLQGLLHGYDNRITLRQCLDEIQSHLAEQF